MWGGGGGGVWGWEWEGVHECVVWVGKDVSEEVQVICV